jgi:hypothetical protein
MHWGDTEASARHRASAAAQRARAEADDARADRAAVGGLSREAARRAVGGRIRLARRTLTPVLSGAFDDVLARTLDRSGAPTLASR